MYPMQQIAKQFQTVSSIEEMDQHVAGFVSFYRSEFTKSALTVLDVLKQHACCVFGVSWLKRENISTLSNVSIPTVERALRLFKELGILKIHQMSKKGRNGGRIKACSFYSFQKFNVEDHLYFEEEELEPETEPAFFCKDENDALLEAAGTHASTVKIDAPKEDKLLKKALPETLSKTHDDECVTAHEDESQRDTEKKVSSGLSQKKEIIEPTFNDLQKKIHDVAIRQFYFNIDTAILFAKECANVAFKTNSLEEVVKNAFNTFVSRLHNKKLPPVISVPAYFYKTLTDTIERLNQKRKHNLQKRIEKVHKQEEEKRNAERALLLRRQVGLS